MCGSRDLCIGNLFWASEVLFAFLFTVRSVTGFGKSFLYPPQKKQWVRTFLSLISFNTDRLFHVIKVLNRKKTFQSVVNINIYIKCILKMFVMNENKRCLKKHRLQWSLLEIWFLFSCWSFWGSRDACCRLGSGAHRGRSERTCSGL